jgi:TPR repeat protein
MRDKRRDLSRAFSTPTDPLRPGLPGGTLQPSGYSVDRELEADDDYQPGAGFDIDEFRVPTSLEGGVILDGPEPPWRSRGIGVDTTLATVAAAAIAAAAIVLVATKFLPPPTEKASSESPNAAVQVERPALVPDAEPQASEPRRAMRPDQRQAMASLVARGKELLLNGDFSSARLILQRAADAGEADAALTLGSTYDPSTLAQLGVRSQVANVDLARTWYEKAQEFGSTEASVRLKMLPNH